MELKDCIFLRKLARATGVDVEIIRYYEKQDMPPERARRDNAAEHLERLSFIRQCRALDLPLADVHRLLGFVDAPLADCSDVDLLVDEQLARVRARVISMSAMEKQLLKLRARYSGTHEAHCEILGGWCRWLIVRLALVIPNQSTSTISKCL